MDAESSGYGNAWNWLSRTNDPQQLVGCLGVLAQRIFQIIVSERNFVGD